MAKPPAKQPDDLSRLLRTWEVDPADDLQLARKVWQRLAAERPSPWRAWLDGLARLLAQPIAASAAVLLFAAVGAGVAELTQASAREARLERLAAEYAHSIDPILMHGRGTDAAAPHGHAR
ncbi:MAG: hypothetical protein IAE82_10740 [Opitutaceae bacterium]|nr:hypothetical protein [Opitutaceae bacterium]